MSRLFVASLKMLYRDRQALFWAIAFPVIFAVVFGLFDFNSSPRLQVGIVAAGPSQVSQALREGLDRVGAFQVRDEPGRRTAQARLMNGDLDIVLLVPPPSSNGRTASTQVKLLYNNAGNAQANAVAISAIRQVTDELNLRLAGVATPPIAVVPRGVAARTTSYYDFLLPGLVGMGVMNFAITGMAVAIAQFRKQQILKRILATPLPPSRFLGGQVGARLVLSLVQTALILMVGVYLFHGHVYGNVVWLFVLAMLGNLIFLNIGFAVAGRAGNPDSAQGVANVIALPMMFLSGVFFPIDSLPKVMQSVVQYLPLTPLIDAMRAVSLQGEPITSLGHELIILFAWIVASLLMAARYFRFSRA